MAFELAPGATTAIGSLPHADGAAAVEFVFASGIDIPFWPQLPKRDFREWMVPQYGAEFPGIRFDAAEKRYSVVRGEDFVDVLTAFYERVLDPGVEFPLKQDHANGYYAFTGRVAGLDRQPDVVKGHVTGPLTFVLGLNADDGRPVYADEELRQAGVQLLARAAGWQARELARRASRGVLLFIDEPIYSALGTAAYLSIRPDDVRASIAEVSAPIRAEGGLTGLHCCGNADWETVLSSDIDVLSFDAWTYAPTIAVYARAISAFLERGGRLAWGIVPTNEDIAIATDDVIAKKLDAAVADLVSRGVDERRLRERAVLTPSCGCGSLSIADTEKVFRLLVAAGRRWSSKA